MNNQPIVPQTKYLASPNARDAWERSNWLWSVLFFMGLIIGLIPALNDGTLSQSMRLWAIGLSILMGCWHIGGLYVSHRIGHFRDGSPFALIYTGGLVAIWFGLVYIHPTFYAAQMGLWSQIFIALPIAWATVYAMGIFALNFYQQTIGIDVASDWLSTLFWLGLTAIGILVGIWIHNIINQSVERKQLIEQLEITRAELAASERAAGIGAERQRLAHEIHDTLAQGFISIIMHLEAADQALPSDATKTAQHVARARQAARESLEQARRVVADLRPEILEQSPFDEAVQRIVADWSVGSGITAVFTHTGDRHPLHPQVEVTLLRAVQEALANVRKHAQAAHVQVTLSYLGDVVILDVEDDGVGFMEGVVDAKTAVSGKFGLVAMRERVEQLGGQLLIESDLNEGTTVAVSIPIEAED